MVQTPYGTDGDNDVRRLKLQLQAQEQYLSQLQQRVANQSSKIEELNNKIDELHLVIQEKDNQIANYSKRIEEERYWKEQDSQARDERENELKKKIRQQELEIDRLKKEQRLQSRNTQTPKLEPVKSNEIEQYIETLIAYYSKPTKDEFIKALHSLIKYSTSNGTPSQRILGSLMKAKLPKKAEDFSSELNLDRNTIERELFNLEKKGLIKKIGKGYSVITSSFVEATDIKEDWASLSPKKILDNLKTIVTITGDKEQIIKAFDKARDSLMELGAISPLMRHSMSQQIERIKRYPLDIEETIGIIDEWIAKIS
ncbi:MAG: hypothetical protein ACTSQE_07180 [Candidatus Heimdallarchaeaceae archaeon]